MQEDIKSKINQFRTIIKQSNKNEIVFFGGAGVSTESGIPDFRSKDGLYNMKYKYPPEMIISHDFFVNNTEEFYKFYFDKMIPSKNILPNITHNLIAKLEKQNIIKSVITQNIDGLHQTAGSENVLELHGSILRNYCTKCGAFYGLEQLQSAYIRNNNKIPVCAHCGGIIKPDVVLYQESLNNKILHQAIYDISQAKTLIIAGTSLSVYPAAGLVDYFNGENLIIINKDATKKDYLADICINDSLGNIFKYI